MHNKKVPRILSLFDYEYVTDFKKKTELFHFFFAKQCSLISNSSELPLNLLYRTEKRLNTSKFCNNDTEKIIPNLDPSNVRGLDKISIRMISAQFVKFCSLPLIIEFTVALIF